MAGINKVILIGNLGRDPELRYTQAGKEVCNLSVATARAWFNKQTNERCEETEWHKVTVWGKQAVSCNEHLVKGRSVYIEGRLRTAKYEDKEGVSRYTTEVVAESVQFLGGRGEGGGQRSNGGGGGAARGGYPPGPEDDDGDIPFAMRFEV